MRTKNKKISIFNFNHIDPNIGLHEFKKIKALYKYYHQLFWCHKAAYKDFKHKSLSLTLISAGLVATGTIVETGVITGSRFVVAAYQKKKDYQAKIKMSKYALQLYEKVSIALRTYIRGEPYNHNEFIHEMQLFDDIITDLAPIIDKIYKAI